MSLAHHEPVKSCYFHHHHHHLFSSKVVVTIVVHLARSSSLLQCICNGDHSNKSNIVTENSNYNNCVQALATGGYIAGNFPPGKMFHFSLAGQVLLNLLKAHCQAYNAVKALPNASGTKFGLTHAMWKFRTAGEGLLYMPAKSV